MLPDANNAENGNKFVAVGDYEQGGVITNFFQISIYNYYSQNLISCLFQNFRTTPLDLPDSNKSIHGYGEVGTKVVSVGEEDQKKVNIYELNSKGQVSLDVDRCVLSS